MSIHRQYSDTWQLRFHLPSDLDREKIPVEVFRQFDSAQHVVTLPRQFNPMPLPGVVIDYEDCRWRITGVSAVARKVGSRKRKVVPIVDVLFLATQFEEPVKT